MPFLKVISNRLYFNFLHRRFTYFCEDELTLLDHYEYFFIFIGFDKVPFRLYNNNVLGRRYFGLTVLWFTLGCGYNYLKRKASQ